MITASFTSDNGRICGFRVSGHSGYSEAGSDIVCAAVSSMAFLVTNTLTENFGVKAKVDSDEETAALSVKIITPSASSDALLEGFLREMRTLASDFADYVRVEIN